jgi:hypothetical protein
MLIYGGRNDNASGTVGSSEFERNSPSELMEFEDLIVFDFESKLWKSIG